MLFSEMGDVGVADFFEAMTNAATIPASSNNAAVTKVQRDRARCSLIV
jgi:hypothetical protein